MTHNCAVTDEKEAEFRRVIGPMIRPLIVIIGNAVRAASDLEDGLNIGHHEQNIEDALFAIIKHCAESELL